MWVAQKDHGDLISVGPGHSVAVLTVRASVGHSNARDGLLIDTSQPTLSELQSRARSLLKIMWKATP